MSSEGRSGLNSVRIIDRDDETLFPYLTKYGGDFMAYSTLQPGLKYFVMDGVGYVPFVPYKNRLFAPEGIAFGISDPIAAKNNYEKLISCFIEKMGPSIFLMVTKDIALVLKKLGHRINQFGGAPEIDIQNFNLKGKDKDHLRRWRNKAIRENVEVKEANIREMDIDAVKKVCESWLKLKGGREYVLMMRAFIYEYERDVRHFWAFQNGRLVGVAGFDPMYEDNKVIGYYKNFARFTEDAPGGTIVLATLHAFEKFKQEGIKRVCLGLSPFSNLDENELNDSKFMFAASKFMYKYCNFIYPFKGNSFHKKRYGGTKKPFYYSSMPDRNILRQVLAAMDVMQYF